MKSGPGTPVPIMFVCKTLEGTDWNRLSLENTITAESRLPQGTKFNGQSNRWAFLSPSD